MPATTSAASTGASTRAPTSTTSRSSRPTRTPTSRCCSTCRSRWASAPRITKLDYAKTLAACLAYLANAQRDRVGLITFDDDDRRARAAVGEAPRRGAAHARPREAGAAGQAGRAAAQAGRALRPPRHHRRDLGFLRRARGDLPRRRADRATAATTSSLFHVLDPQEIEFRSTDPSSFEDLESGEQMPVVPDQAGRRLPRAGAGAHRRADARRRRSSRSTTCCSTPAAARLRAVPVPVDARSGWRGRGKPCRFSRRSFCSAWPRSRCRC